MSNVPAIRTFLPILDQLIFNFFNHLIKIITFFIPFSNFDLAY